MPVFLFTDIEGSTQLWEHHGEAMARVLLRHDAILAEHVSKHGGRIVKHTGDGVFAVFEEGEPLACTLAIQKHLSQEAWYPVRDLRVRMVLHAGEAEKRENDYFGSVVNHTAHLLPLGWGGQILFTAAVLDVAGLPEAATLRDLGSYMLQEVSRPQHIFTFIHPDLPYTEFPPLRAIAVRAHNLPPQTTAFVGREKELGDILRRLQNPACHLLSLVGPGGMGKTRLAIQAATEQLNNFSHGVYFVALAPINAADFIIPAIADKVNFSFSGRQPPSIQLLNYLRTKEILLVLDNFEHVLTAAGLLSDILKNAPAVKLLVTSRERLNLPQEWIYPVQGMRFPQEELVDEVKALTLSTALSNLYDAVQLFLQGARRVQPDFTLSEEDQMAVVRICRLVEGMPLGIEIVAAWVRILSCQEIADELERSFAFLSTAHDALDGSWQRLQPVFDYLWNFLAGPEKKVLMRLSLFRGGFKREAAEEVAGASFFFLSALVDKALLRKLPSGRYEMHEVLRQYAAEKLAEHPEEKEQAQRQHACFYACLLQQKEQQFKGEGPKGALIEIGEEIENVRAGWQWMVSRLADQDQQAAPVTELNRYAESLYLFYETRGWFQEGEETFGKGVVALAGPAIVPEEVMAGRPDAEKLTVLARLLARQAIFCSHLAHYQKARELLMTSLYIVRALKNTAETAFAIEKLAGVAYLLGEYDEAYDYYQESLAMFQKIGDRRGQAISLKSLGNIHYMRGHFTEAEQFYQPSLKLSQDSGFHQGIGDVKNNLANVACALGDYVQARQLYQECLAIYREIGRQSSTAIAINNLANMASHLGDYTEAKQLYHECLVTHRKTGDQKMAAFSLKNLGDVSCTLGAYTEAERWYQQSMAIFQEISDRREIGYSYNHLGDVARAQQEYEKARQLYQQGLAIFQEIDYEPGLSYTMDNLGTVARLQGRYAKADQWYRQSLTLQQARENREGIAFSLNNLGLLAAATGDYEQATQLHREGLAIFSEITARRGIVLALNHLGNVAYSTGDYEEVWRLFCDALKMAVDSQAMRLILYTLVGVAQVLARPPGQAEEPDATLAVELLSLILYHPASDRETQDKAEQLLVQLEGHLPAAVIAQAKASGRTRTVGEVVATILHDQMAVVSDQSMS